MAAPIRHVVIIVKENHTFDNYFGTFPGAAGVQLPPAADPMVVDPPHDHRAWLAGGGVRQQYGRDDIPVYWTYAQQYSLCDNYFTDVASQSEPNHLFLIAADSPVVDNSSPSRLYQPSPPFQLPNLPAALQAGGRQWRNYAEANTSYFRHLADLAASPWNVSSSRFDQDASTGSLPDVAWLYAPDGLSEHPGDPHRAGRPGVRQGMQWTADRVQAVASGPAWRQTAVFITWDDWGGWYDHVTPPLAQAWSGGGPAGYRDSQFRYGPRVPCLAISPYAKQGINHAFYSHASIVKFCLRLFGLKSWPAPALRPGDTSGDLWDCFDFAASPRVGMPATAPFP